MTSFGQLVTVAKIAVDKSDKVFTLVPAHFEHCICMVNLQCCCGSQLQLSSCQIHQEKHQKIKSSILYISSFFMFQNCLYLLFSPCCYSFLLHLFKNSPISDLYKIPMYLGQQNNKNLLFSSHLISLLSPSLTLIICNRVLV